MIYRTLKEIENSSYNVDCGNGRSRRFLIKNDNMGFTLTDTLIEKGSVTEMEYTNHLEACYCISGEGEVEADGCIYTIAPGTMYALNQHDRHTLRAKTELRLICVFTPALAGLESHKSNNSEASGY